MIKQYKGVDYIVWENERPYMKHFCAYVKLPKGHPLIKKLKKKRYYEFNGIKCGKHNYEGLGIECHWGLTFGTYVYKKYSHPQGFTNGWWVGWDYAHFGDDIYTDEMVEKLGLESQKYMKRWTEEEVEEEVYQVIEQIINYEKD